MGKKIWLNSKYIKIKRNKKLDNKFFGPFQVLHIVRKQVYKLELPTKLKIYDVLYMSLLEQDITRKKRVDDTLVVPKREFKAGDNKKYEIKVIVNSTVYYQQANNQISDLFILFYGKIIEKKKTSGSLHQ